ncbi:MAG: hypothetical protein KAX05_06445 [Bacteroidales bacterium]|nr:hypothetical protein [Bacteroidales bacterium]
MAWSFSMLKNYYTTQDGDAWDVIMETMPELKSLEKQTIEFVKVFIETEWTGNGKLVGCTGVNRIQLFSRYC